MLLVNVLLKRIQFAGFDDFMIDSTKVERC